jgi:hypothetical protein
MSRERKNAPELSKGEGVRRRLSAQPEIDLTDEELRALADEGIDPDEVRRIAREGGKSLEASEHDRDTARDEIEGLVLGQDDDY